MTRKRILALVIALVLVSPVFAQASLETYTASDGSFTINYPQGWIVEGGPGYAILQTSRDTPMDDVSVLQSGQAYLTLQIIDPSMRVQIDNDNPGKTLSEKLIGMVQPPGTKPGGGIVFTQTIDTAVGRYPAGIAAGKIEATGNAIELILEDFQNGGYGMIVIETAPNELDRVEAKMRSLAASIVYRPPTPATIFGELTPISVQNAQQVNLVYTIDTQSGIVPAIAISPDGQTIASGSYEGKILLWSVATGQDRPSPEPQESGIQQLAYTPDGTRLISAQSDGSIRLWDTRTNKQQALRQHDDGIWWMALSPDGQLVAYVSYTGTPQAITSSTLWLWTLGTDDDRKIISFPDGVLVNSVAFNPDGDQLLYSTTNGSGFDVSLVDVATQHEIHHWSGQGDGIDVFFTADANPMVSKTSDEQSFDVMLWNALTGRTRLTLKGHQQSIYQTLLNADRTILGTASYDGTVRLWDMQTGTNLVLLPNGNTAALGMAFSRDSRLLVTSNADGRLFEWGIVS